MKSFSFISLKDTENKAASETDRYEIVKNNGSIIPSCLMTGKLLCWWLRRLRDTNKRRRGKMD